jgi:ubiquinone/menaquinone biosynthesis C-methylase UbiE
MKSAFELHKDTPKGWYYKSIKIDPLQRYWHKKRFREVSKLIQEVNGKVLDIGCADGIFSKVIFDKTRAKGLIGIDIVPSSIDWARNHWKTIRKMKFRVGDAEKLNFKKNSFDAVFALEMLEHVNRPKEVIKEVKRVLKKDGYAIFLVPTDSILFRLIWFLWVHFYPRGYVWKETHLQTFRNNILPKICEQEGFIIENDKKFILSMLQAVKVRRRNKYGDYKT